MNTRESYDHCCDCECSSHQIRACNGRPKSVKPEPERRIAPGSGVVYVTLAGVALALVVAHVIGIVVK